MFYLYEVAYVVTSHKFTTFVLDPSDDDTTECLRSADGLQYVGTTSETLSGRICQHRSSEYPHQHYFNDIDMFYDYEFNLYAEISDVSNYCRNPVVGSSHRHLPWCYTNSNDVTWEFCNIPRCKGI